MFERSPTMTLQKSFTSVDVSFTFGKSNRFREDKRRATGFYEIPTAFSKRSTSFGFGARSPLFKPSFSPSPDYYSPKYFQPKAPTISKSHLGGRLKLGNTTNPGPGTYNVLYHDGSPKFLFQGRPIEKKKDDSPCAANYNPNFGFVFKSKYKKIGFGIGEKGGVKNTMVPGPGAYSMPDLFKKAKEKKVRMIHKEIKKTKSIMSMSLISNKVE
jgi:hypothetical protein